MEEMTYFHHITAEKANKDIDPARTTDVDGSTAGCLVVEYSEGTMDGVKNDNNSEASTSAGFTTNEIEVSSRSSMPPTNGPNIESAPQIDEQKIESIEPNKNAERDTSNHLNPAVDLYHDDGYIDNVEVPEEQNAYYLDDEVEVSAPPSDQHLYETDNKVSEKDIRESCRTPEKASTAATDSEAHTSAQDRIDSSSIFSSGQNNCSENRRHRTQSSIDIVEQESFSRSIGGEEEVDKEKENEEEYGPPPETLMTSATGLNQSTSNRMSTLKSRESSFADQSREDRRRASGQTSRYEEGSEEQENEEEDEEARPRGATPKRRRSTKSPTSSSLHANHHEKAPSPPPADATSAAAASTKDTSPMGRLLAALGCVNEVAARWGLRQGRREGGDVVHADDVNNAVSGSKPGDILKTKESSVDLQQRDPSEQPEVSHQCGGHPRRKRCRSKACRRTQSQRQLKFATCSLVLYDVIDKISRKKVKGNGSRRLDDIRPRRKAWTQVVQGGGGYSPSGWNRTQSPHLQYQGYTDAHIHYLLTAGCSHVTHHSTGGGGSQVPAGVRFHRKEQSEKEHEKPKPKACDGCSMLSTDLCPPDLHPLTTSDTRWLGELAFQLERRILDFVFGSKGAVTRLYYGYTVGNTCAMLEREAREEVQEETFKRDFSNIMRDLAFCSHTGSHGPLHEGGKKNKKNYKNKAAAVGQSKSTTSTPGVLAVERLARLNGIVGALGRFGYDLQVTAEFCRQTIHKYGVLCQHPPDTFMSVHHLHESRGVSQLITSLTHSPTERHCLHVVLHCLTAMSLCDGRPVFVWG